MEKYIGLDIGGTKCAAVIGSLSDSVQIEDKIQFPTAGKTPDEILALFSAFIQQKLDGGEQIAGIGIACGSPLNSRLGIIQRPPSLPLWDNIPVVEYFESKFGIKTYLQNDANACAVAEWRYGAGRGTQNMIYLTFGTGFGAGLILDGRLFAGANDNAGEIGHVRLTPTGPLGYFKKGSCEGYCSGGGIRRYALILKEKWQKSGRSSAFLQSSAEEDITAKTLAEGARAGDAFCKAVYKKSGEMLGRSLSILIDLFNPERIAIGGVFMRSHDLLLSHAKRVIAREALPFAAEVCEIVPAALSENIGDVSALTVAKGDFL